MNNPKKTFDNLFIFWLGLRSIMSELKHYPDEAEDSSSVHKNTNSSSGGRFDNIFDDINQTSTSSNNADKSNMIYIDEDEIRNNPDIMDTFRSLGISVEEFIEASEGFSSANEFADTNSSVTRHNTLGSTKQATNAPSIYNASADIANIIASGSKQRIYSIMHTDSNTAFRLHNEIKVDSFSHIIITESSELERDKWDISANSTVPQPGISAQYIRGNEIKTFKPYIVKT